MQEIKKHRKDLVLYLKMFVWQLKMHIIRIKFLMLKKLSKTSRKLLVL